MLSYNKEKTLLRVNSIKNTAILEFKWDLRKAKDYETKIISVLENYCSKYFLQLSYLVSETLNEIKEHFKNTISSDLWCTLMIKLCFEVV